jgi:uncharacterized protein with ACT and thioredoxin-like domain
VVWGEAVESSSVEKYLAHYTRKRRKSGRICYTRMQESDKTGSMALMYFRIRRLRDMERIEVLLAEFQSPVVVVEVYSTIPLLFNLRQ